MTVEQTKDEIAEIRRLLKKRAPTLSVKAGKGTAYGWVDIGGSGEFGSFTEHERAVLTELGWHPGGNFCPIEPSGRVVALRQLGAEVDDADLPRCIVCRAPAVVDFGCNCDLTHWLREEHRDIPRKDCAFLVRGPAGR